MNDKKIFFRNITSSAFKVFIPLSLIILFLFPLFYYVCLIWVTGISRNYDTYFEIKGENKVVFMNKKPSSWVSLKEVNSSAVWPIVVSEDWGFYQHAGVDWEQMKIVLTDAVNNLSFKRGASTITQQVIKNLFLNDERSFIRKFNEIILAYYLESKVSKKWILEQYINLAEFDKNIYGIRAASYHFFKKHPSQLRFKEGAFLAMLLPSPKKYSISFYKKMLTPYANKTITRILGKLVLAKIISKERMFDEIQTPFSWEENLNVIGFDILDKVIDEIKRGEDVKLEEEASSHYDSTTLNSNTEDSQTIENIEPQSIETKEKFEEINK